MNEKKQIEEMAEDLCDIDCKGMKCNVCDSYGCEYRVQAEALYNAGYRKQSEGEWTAYPDEHEICATEFVCSKCKESFCTGEMTDWEFIETMKYCPNCGARMKGGDTDA